MAHAAFYIDLEAGAEGDLLTIMMNDRFCRLDFSEAAMEEYHKIKPEFQEHHIRDDRVMVAVVKRLGQSSNGRSAEISLQDIPKIYQDYYEIDESGGCELVRILFSDYMIDKLTAVLSNPNLTSEQKNTGTLEVIATVKWSV